MTVGTMGMRRRIVDYDPTLGGGLVEARHLETTIAAFLIGLSILIMIYNLVTSAEIGVRATFQSLAFPFTRVANSFPQYRNTASPLLLRLLANLTTMVGKTNTL